jgi:hypothetical protein
MTEKQSGDEALRSTLKHAKGMIPSREWAKTADHLTAKSVLHTDLGHHSDDLRIYHLDVDTRDRLIAHARQDAAQAVCHASTLMDEVRHLKRRMNLISLMLAVVLLTSLLGLWKAWFFGG